MKNLIKTVIAAFFLTISFALEAQEVVYGNVEYDGYRNIKKGAFWASRPEAKEVFNGGYPQNVTVYVLNQDNFVRFAPKNHTAKTRNYIVFPAGAKVYKKNGKFYAAVCGNKIVFIKPVNQVVIKEKIVYRDRQPKKPIVSMCNTQEAIAQFNNVQLAANANPAAFAQYQQQVVALRQAYPCLPPTLMLVKPACIDCNRPQQQDDCATGLREVYDLKSRYTNFFSFMGLEKANRELELIKQRYPCIPRHYRFERAHKGLKQGGAALAVLVGIDAIDGRVDGFGLFSSSNNTSRANNGGYHPADDIRTPSKDGYNDGDYNPADNNSGGGTGGGGYNHGNRAYNGAKNYGSKTTLSRVMRTPSRKGTFAGF